MAMCYPDSTDWSCVGTPEELAELDPTIKARSEMLAWSHLARLTGFRLSVCPTVLRPCRVRCAPEGRLVAPVSGFGDGGYAPYIENGFWYNACGCSGDACGCGVIRELVLPDSEVSGPIVVRINGATLDPSAYRIDNGNRLVRQDGADWPMCQDMNAPLFVPPVFEPVTLTWPNGQKVTLTRSADIVTATTQVTGITTMDTSVKPWPAAHFKPKGDASMYLDPVNTYLLTVSDGALGVDGIAFFANGTTAPWANGSVQWLAEPVPMAEPGGVREARVTWPDGSTVDLSRNGDVVTAVVDPKGSSTILPIPYPEVFGPAGVTDVVSLAYGVFGQPGSLAILVGEASLGASPGIRIVAVAPFAGPTTFTWLAEPLSATGQDTFTVSYYVGVGPDEMLNYAAGILAGEWYKACIGQDCRLPDAAAKVVRQGVSFEIPSFDSGSSGIREVDNIVANYNPHHVKTPSRVVSVDSIRGRKRTA